ncbi:MAG: hypothetical protein GVY33_11450 [Alphaproteobacteria bacterium]|jgi:hypothetical protein|nr:hypothetical protein [Alphaproteobacteria bacterium]
MRGGDELWLPDGRVMPYRRVHEPPPRRTPRPPMRRAPAAGDRRGAAPADGERGRHLDMVV